MPLLKILSWCYMGISLIAFFIILVDLLMGQSQKMKIMNLVWPISALYLGPFALYFYFKHEKVRPNKQCCCRYFKNKKISKSHTCCQTRNKATCNLEKIEPHDMASHHHMNSEHQEHQMSSTAPSLKSVFISSLHCGAGCVLGDIVAEIVILFAAITLFGAATWASFFLDYAAALLFGLVFQYYTIKPMKPHFGFKQILSQAFKADFLSLTFFEIGLFGWMLACYFIFTPVLKADQITFWFMMQIGMILGLLTTMPINYLLIKLGIKSNCSE